METIVQGKEYRFVDEGFQAEHTEGIISYDKIIRIKKDVSCSNYEVVYFNEKGEQQKVEFHVEEDHVNDVDQLLKSKLHDMTSITRDKTILECATFWIWLLGMLVFVSGITICLMLSSRGSVRLPIVIIPLVKLGLKIGLKNIIIVDVVVAVLGVVGTLSSYKKKNKVEIYKK